MRSRAHGLAAASLRNVPQAADWIDMGILPAVLYVALVVAIIIGFSWELFVLGANPKGAVAHIPA